MAGQSHVLCSVVLIHTWVESSIVQLEVRVTYSAFVLRLDEVPAVPGLLNLVEVCGWTCLVVVRPTLLAYVSFALDGVLEPVA